MQPKYMPQSNRAFVGLAIMSLIIGMMMYSSFGA